ncbi:hypothetical protein C8F04DRAFT_1194990 [Mycena alexandri]|uniref:Uncharacterized protein n=1 Tax=Mycena alexandri TaxID=1745969 RepID=A0AAD6S830_9AGAR|nr:hypothetical protein C8F04DRAFT_1194990 [Mycena alexandri]
MDLNPPIEIDSDDDTEWVPGEWIGRGKKYENIPAHVDAARRCILHLPASVQSHFPPKNLPISRLLLFDLPPVARDETLLDYTYTTMEPTRNIEDSLAFLAVPSRRVLQQMVSNFGQAWFDANKSICTSLNPDIAYSFWI